ncbi:MAG: hypothetical protein V4596_07290 [Bdellovibrionota bacterium]
MKVIFALLLLVSTNAFAIPDEELAEKCLSAGKEKITLQADILGCKIISEVEAVGVDNRWYNPIKYVWYAAYLECPQSTYELEKMVQYSGGECL